jgi:hypothetical protein
VLNRILRCHGHEWRLQWRRLAFNGDLVFLHNLQQCSLGFGRRPIDFVSQQQVGKHRSATDPKRFRLRVVNGVAANVAGHQIGRKLNSRKRATNGFRHGLDQQGLSQAGNAFQQDMPTGQQCGQNGVDDFTLANECLADLGAQADDFLQQCRSLRLIFRHSFVLMRCNVCAL